MPKLGVGSIVMKDGATVLLVKALLGPDADKWALPISDVEDQESVRQAAIRSVKDVAGIEVDAKQSLFFCETVEPEDHRVTLFCLAVPVGDAEKLTPNSTICTAVKWCDVRELGRIQDEEGMSDHSANAFVKFSDFLRAQAPPPTIGAPSDIIN